jgi:hypothetical protein
MQQFEEIKALLGESGTYYLIAVGMDSNYSYVNKRYADIFEPLYGSLVGTHYSVTMHPDDLHTCEVVSQLAFANLNSVFPATIRKHDGKGGYLITRWEYKAMVNDDGTPLGMFCIGHDITELMQVSGELDQVKYSHSHAVRRHVANLIGLGKLVNEADEVEDIHDAAKMIVASANELDSVIKELYH